MPGDVRSLNLANAVSVVLYEGLRQLDIALPDGAILQDDGGAAAGAVGGGPAARKGARRGGRGRGGSTPR